MLRNDSEFFLFRWDSRHWVGWLGLAAMLVAFSVDPLRSMGQAPATDVWVLQFEDDFERTDLGEAWETEDGLIRDGRMLLGLKGPAVAKLVRPYPGDVRIEFEAQAYEKRPPCDLSVTLAAERLRSRSWNYMLAFGGNNNTANKLTGGRRMKGVHDTNPERLVEPGRVYHMVATKEGKKLSLVVDGQTLLEDSDEEVMGGPGFDAVGLVTWNGMYVDNVRVYERKEPHPDTPRYVSSLQGLVLREAADGAGLIVPPDASSAVRKAVEAYNREELVEAEKLFLALEGEVRAAGLAYVYGHLYHDEKPDDFPRVAELFRELSVASPNDHRLADYAWAAQQFGRIRLFPRSNKECSLLVYLGPRNNPFYDKAKLYLARFLRANGQEGGDRALVAKTIEMFRELKTKAPKCVVLRELTGEKIPWGDELIPTDSSMPEWAALLQEMYARQLAIMEWWFTQRQLPDGQLGGGWGDDVELLRSWGPFAMISDANPTVRNGIERLCDGVWRHVLVDGFDRAIGDVEHAAEPSADTLPTMVPLRYGDPMWFERNLTSCRRIRDDYTGIDDNGYVRFKSGHFGGKGASTHLAHGGDTYYSTRPMKHLFWAAWYGDQPARKLYLNWVEGWVKATMTARYTKPAGVPPGTIWYPSGDIAPNAEIPWNDPIYNIYGCCWIGNFWVQDMFLAGYYLSRDPLFLQPLHSWMARYQTEVPEDLPERPDIDKDPEGWAIHNARDTWNAERTLVEYRWMTGDAGYDELFGRQRWQQRLHLPNDLDSFVLHLRKVVDSLRVNFNLYTREVLQTDRAGLPGDALAFAAMTGAVRKWNDAGVPTMSVTWEVPNAQFAGFVESTSPDHVRVWVYNSSKANTRIGLRFWRLVPGEYVVHSGPIVEGKGFDRRYRWTQPDRFHLRHRADVYWMELRPGIETAIDLRLSREDRRPDRLPDPAVADRDLEIVKGNGAGRQLNVTVHNLGNEPVRGLTVALCVSEGGDLRELARQQLPVLPASAELKSGQAVVAFDNLEKTEGLRVVLDPDQMVDEVYELNNEGILHH